MSKRSPKPKRETWIEVWKHTRKDPVPPRRVFQPKDRELEADAAQDEIDEALAERYEDFEE